MDNWTRKAALRVLVTPPPGEDEALLLSELAFARRLSEALGRPLSQIGSREYTEHRALSVIGYAQDKIREARAARKVR